MKKQITIIIPTYNMEKYIGKCLDSLLIPELDQIEVLVVNDGSKDRSSEIAHNYADKYPDSIRVIDKENGNYGSCINTALPLVNGRYVKVLDADDTFDSAAFSKLVRRLSETNDDVVLTNHAIVNEDNSIIETTSFDGLCQECVSMSVEEATKSVLSAYVQMHRIAYKTDVFTRFSYHQTEGISYTDSQWSVIPMAYCNSARYENLCVYRYLMGREGQTMSVPQMKKCLKNFFTALADTVKYYNKYNHSACGKQLLLTGITQIHEFVYRKSLSMNTPDAMESLKLHDAELKYACPDIYSKVGEIPWTDEVPFRFISDLRRKKYPSDYNIPFLKRLQLSLYIRLKK